MTNEQRARILVRIREDRLRRQGQPREVDPDAVWREVVASQRLSGIEVPDEWCPVDFRPRS